MYAVSGNIFALWSVWIHVDFFSKNVWQMRISLFGVLNDAGGIFISKLHAENTVFFSYFLFVILQVNMFGIRSRKANITTTSVLFQETVTKVFSSSNRKLFIM